MFFFFSPYFFLLDGLMDRLDAFLDGLFSLRPFSFFLSDGFFFGMQLLLGFLLPVAGVAAGIVLANLRREKLWYLLSAICGAILIRGFVQTVLAMFLALLLFA